MTDSSDNQVAAESGTEGHQTSTTVPVATIFADPGGSTTDSVSSSSTSTASVIGIEGVGIHTQKILGKGSEGAQGSTEQNSAVRISNNNVTPEVIINVTTSAENLALSPPSSSTVVTSSTPDTVIISIIQSAGNRLTSSLTSPVDIDTLSSTANINSTETTPEMSGNPSRSSSGSNSGPPNNASSSSSSRRQRNGLFGINLDLNFDPSSWLVPSNVAGRSISSLSVLPDWVRSPASIIPNRSSGDTHSSPGIGAGEGRQSQQPHYLHQHYGPGTGTASRMVSHHQPSHQSTGDAERTNWGSTSSSFQSSSSIPSNMHHHHHHHQLHATPRTRHLNTMRSVDEDLDADYNPVSTIDIGTAGREHRGNDSHSYVIDMDSPMGGWTEDDHATSPLQPLRGVSSSLGGGLNNAASSPTDATGASPGRGGEGGGISNNRRSASADLGVGAIPGGQGMGGPGGQPGDPNGPSMADATTGANERTRAAEILRDAPETRAFINEISRYTTIRPFIVINFLKGVFDHGTSILAFLALVVTFSHANSMVKKEVSKQRKRNLLYLTMIVINLMACVAFIYYIFNEMELYYALVFMPTRSDLSAFWSLMWAVGVTDYVAKFGTVFVKIAVVGLPGCILPFQKRGKFYLFIEYSSQLYRSFLPVYPWLFYLVSAYEGTARMFGLLLAGIYVGFKITDSVKRFKDWLKALEKLLSNVHYGSNPTPKQLDGAGSICPICHDTFANPTRLQCSHIFCEECVATWFDRERTCPMCRAKVVDDPTYRDGSTSQYIQLF